MPDAKEPVLSEEDRKIFEAVEKNDAVLLKTLLTDKKDVNFIDQNLMTPLQHAAYKGNSEMVQMLLDQVKLVLMTVTFCTCFEVMLWTIL